MSTIMQITTSFILTLVFLTLVKVNDAVYQIGVGRADCTGPIVEIGFMGYAQLQQKGQGIHLRQFSRAFIIEKNDKRVVFVSVDTGMMGHAVKRDVIKRLQKLYGDRFTMDNVAISGTHTHSAPGGFLMHLLYDISILGFVQQTYLALVEGIFNSIVRAHNNMQSGKIYLARNEVHGVNINRSPTSYLDNPATERAQFAYDVDKILTQMRFVNAENNTIIGAINWYAVHPTSMNNTNHLVSSDNVGYASLLLEMKFNPNDMPGKGKFVGAFASTNLGDVSPNIRGPKCQRSGKSCDILTSKCPSKEDQCVASGPGSNMFESTKIIATRLYNGAMELIKQSSGREVNGKVNFIHQFVDMPNYRSNILNLTTGKIDKIHGCLPAMGYSFAAGTTDGPGSLHFEQGTTTDNRVWNAVRDFISHPTPEDIKCHAPKPIILATGRAKFPYDWQPKIVATQLLQIGDVIIAAVPGEFTTMSGRRFRNMIRDSLISTYNYTVDVIIAGLSNVYTSYITTFEEYQAQRYEAASTIYGPHTLSIYIDQYKKLAEFMIQNVTIDPGPYPAYLDNKVISLNTNVIYDGRPLGRTYGSVRKQPRTLYKRGETVYVIFVSGNPRNNLMHDSTFLTVERKTVNNQWEVIHTDGSWQTIFRWHRVSTIFGLSDAHIAWTIEDTAKSGIYRIRHCGYYKFILGGIYPYEGISSSFEVL